MIKVEEAIEIVLDNIKVLNIEKVKIRSSLGQVLAENIYSDLDIPPFDNSVMDGYAVMASDTGGRLLITPKRSVWWRM